MDYRNDSVNNGTLSLLVYEGGVVFTQAALGILCSSRERRLLN
jgi:hypothetical protein